jgi:flagellar basal-body rod protein FlgB
VKQKIGRFCRQQSAEFAGEERIRSLLSIAANGLAATRSGARAKEKAVPSHGTEVAMLSSLFQSSTIPVLEQVVNFTEARHGVLAGNVANLDTPGYKTRDLSPTLFRERLKEAIETRHQPTSPTHEGDALGLSPTYNPQRRQDKQLAAFQKVKDSMKSIVRHDGDDVSMEHQVNEIMKNQQQHSLAIHIMSAQFRLLKAAITERVA